MTFDLTAQQDHWSSRARDFSRTIVAELAPQIDQSGVIPRDVGETLTSRGLGNPFDDDAIAAAVAVEEMAAVSSGVATAFGVAWAGSRTLESSSQTHEGDGLPGLRGSGLVAAPQDLRSRLVLCAVAVGVGRAAIALGVESMKSRGIKPSGEETTPHWTLADAAAELDAARLLVFSAARELERDEGASLFLASRLSTIAVERAAEAASLIVGVEGYRPGSALERLTRDARTLRLLLSP